MSFFTDAIRANQEKMKGAIAQVKAQQQQEQAAVDQAKVEISQATVPSPSIWDSRIVQFALLGIALTFIGVQVLGKKKK